MLHSVALKMDALGLRPLVARVATLAYRGQTFSVDEDGHWVNRQAEATIVSPVIHTTPYAVFRDWVLDNWTWRYVPKAGDVIVDLGSGVGEEAVIFSRLIGPQGLMIAVEAHPETYHALTKTIAGSRLSNVRPVHCAVAGKDGTATISSGSHLGNSIFGGGDQLVPQMSLETLTRDLPVIDFLRSNIEGAERLAIRGPALAKVRNACISCHDFIGRKAKADVRQALEAAGFVVEGRDEGPPWMRDYLYATRASSSEHS